MGHPQIEYPRDRDGREAAGEGLCAHGDVVDQEFVASQITSPVLLEPREYTPKGKHRSFGVMDSSGKSLT
jgi:hypothetical protein